MHSSINSKLELSHDFNLFFTLGHGPMFRRDNNVRESGFHVFPKMKIVGRLEVYLRDFGQTSGCSPTL